MQFEGEELDFEFVDELNFDFEADFREVPEEIPIDILELIDSWGDEPVIEDFINNLEIESFCFTKPIFENEFNIDFEKKYQSCSRNEFHS